MIQHLIQLHIPQNIQHKFHQNLNQYSINPTTFPSFNVTIEPTLEPTMIASEYPSMEPIITTIITTPNPIEIDFVKEKTMSPTFEDLLRYTK